MYKNNGLLFGAYSKKTYLCTDVRKKLTLITIHNNNR